MMSDDAWKAAWDPVVAAVGRDFSDGASEGADAVERGLVRRYLEPLEFDCPLHYDDAAAEAHGYGGMIAPYSSYLAFAVAPIWSPGDAPVFTSDERDAQPARAAIRPPASGLEPPYTGYFATDFEIEFLAPLSLGDRVSRSGMRLASCEPKETRVGRGAFVGWEWDLVNQRGEEVAQIRVALFLYNPRETSSEQAVEAAAAGRS